MPLQLCVSEVCSSEAVVFRLRYRMHSLKRKNWLMEKCPGLMARMIFLFLSLVKFRFCWSSPWNGWLVRAKKDLGCELSWPEVAESRSWLVGAEARKPRRHLLEDLQRVRHCPDRGQYHKTWRISFLRIRIKKLNSAVPYNDFFRKLMRLIYGEKVTEIIIT